MGKDLHVRVRSSLFSVTASTCRSVGPPLGFYQEPNLNLSKGCFIASLYSFEARRHNSRGPSAACGGRRLSLKGFVMVSIFSAAADVHGQAIRPPGHGVSDH